MKTLLALLICVAATSTASAESNCHYVSVYVCDSDNNNCRSESRYMCHESDSDAPAPIESGTDSGCFRTTVCSRDYVYNPSTGLSDWQESCYSVCQ